MVLNAPTAQINLNLQFEELLSNLKAKMHNVLHERDSADRIGISRGMPPFIMREIMSANPFKAVVPTELGGLGGDVAQSIALMSAASYESLALSLTFGINMALFLQPTLKYGQYAIKQEVAKRFVTSQNMGGLMITEPDFGSDALSMRTENTKTNKGYHIKGIKHWAGLTGWADFWLLTSREKTASGALARDIDFFVADVSKAEQQIVVEERFENLGLYQIPYGRNRLDLVVPQENKLIPQSTGLKLMLDLLHRSRMSFPGMAMGFINRMLDEALDHTQQRIVSGKRLLDYDQIDERVSRIQNSYTVVSAMCYNSSLVAHLENDLSGIGIEANSVKSLATDMMQESAQTLLQVVGAKGYKHNHIAGRAIVDSRPFQIFEGSNDMLYTQVSEQVIKLMKNSKETNLLNFLASYPSTKLSANLFKDDLNITIDYNLQQRKLVDLGRIIAHVVVSQMVLQLEAKGYRKDLINNAVDQLRLDNQRLLTAINFKQRTSVVVDYKDNSNWRDLLK